MVVRPNSATHFNEETERDSFYGRILQDCGARKPFFGVQKFYFDGRIPSAASIFGFSVAKFEKQQRTTQVR
jgi:hypothetical protein